MKKIITLSMIIFLSAAAFSETEDLITILKEKENNALATAKSAAQEAEYFSKLISLMNKAISNKKRYGKEARNEILNGFKTYKISDSYKRSAFIFFTENDPIFIEFIKSNPVSIIINSNKKKIDADISNLMSDSIQLSLKENRIIYSSTDYNLLITVDLEISSQKVPFEEIKMNSRRAGGNIRILHKDGTLKASSFISEAAIHIDEKTASKNAVKRLSDKTAEAIVNFFLTEAMKSN